jgi:hypothetical protein
MAISKQRETLVRILTHLTLQIAVFTVAGAALAFALSATGSNV